MLFKSSKEEPSEAEERGFVNKSHPWLWLEEFGFRRNHLRFQQSRASLMETEVWLGCEAKRHSKRAE